MVGILLPLLLLIAFGCPQSQGLLKHFFIPSRDYPKAAALDTYSRHSLCNHGKTASGTENDGLRSRAAFLAIESSIGGHFTRNGFCFQEIAALKRTSSSSHRAHSRSALFSSVKHLETQWEISEDSGILEVPEPINLFHSVLCGSHSTFDLAKLPSNGEPAVAVKQKIPIILLHGLLGSARNFQSWMKLVQQKEAQIDGDETKMKTEAQSGSPSPLSPATRDVICMDLRNHGRTAVHYGSKEMDFELMARDFLHTLKSLGLSDVHVVGHSLGGKVAAVAALQLAEQARKDELREQSVGGGEEDANDESAVELSHSKPKLKLKLLSLTLIDVSPVDYEADDAFADVLRTLDIVEDLNGQLLHLGQVQDNGDRSDSHSSAGRDVTVANVRVQLNSLLGEKVADPMLKAFLMASIQPKEEKTLGPGFRDVSSPVRALMQRIGTSRDRLAQQQSGGLGSDAQQSSNQKEEDKEEEENVHGSSTCAVSEGSSLTSTLPNKEADTAAGNLIAASIPVSVPTSGGFEWKFSVDGIAGFRNKLCGWPSLYATQDRGDASPLTPYLEPVLLMKGANSKFVRSSHIPSISAMFPMFTLVTVRDAGHWLHFEKPNESSESLIRFILRVEERGRADS